MKTYRQPLSESFVYCSPERPVGGSFRWVNPVKVVRTLQRRKEREVGYEIRRKT
ncbi:MAG: hypothetical protein KZQ85_00745 [Candidatus Thiodiazotropha sp. (ex Myrtea sp. 'scaly one' KF741663)]|nr:hypothetical protein [Candidatus Thiodiazotropha sp. (ex Myrtea sp. 'scaly one' KF741663)]